MVAFPFLMAAVLQVHTHNADVGLDALVCQIVCQGAKLIVCPRLPLPEFIAGRAVVRAVVGMESKFLVHARMLIDDVGVEQENGHSLGDKACLVQIFTDTFVFLIPVESDQRHPDKVVAFFHSDHDPIFIL